jgi:hypothetical protein
MECLLRGLPRGEALRGIFGPTRNSTFPRLIAAMADGSGDRQAFTNQFRWRICNMDDV